MGLRYVMGMWVDDENNVVEKPAPEQTGLTPSAPAPASKTSPAQPVTAQPVAQQDNNEGEDDYLVGMSSPYAPATGLLSNALNPNDNSAEALANIYNAAPITRRAGSEESGWGAEYQTTAADERWGYQHPENVFAKANQEAVQGMASNSQEWQQANREFQQGGIDAVSDVRYKDLFKPFADYFQSGELTGLNSQQTAEQFQKAQQQWTQDNKASGFDNLMEAATIAVIGTAGGMALGSVMGGTGAAVSAATPAVTGTATGGSLVGTNGMLWAGTNNAVVDAVLNEAVFGSLKSGGLAAITGQDIGDAMTKGFISGGVTGGVGYGVDNFLPKGETLLGSTTLNNAARGAIKQGATAAFTGKDVGRSIVAGGLTGGVMPLLVGKDGLVDKLIPPPDGGGHYNVNNFTKDILEGAARGGSGAYVSGKDITDAMLVGMAGGAGGFLLGGLAEDGSVLDQFLTQGGLTLGTLAGSALAHGGKPTVEEINTYTGTPRPTYRGRGGGGGEAEPTGGGLMSSGRMVKGGNLGVNEYMRRRA